MPDHYTQIAWQIVTIAPTITASGDPATGLVISATVDAQPSVNRVNETSPGEYELQLDTSEVKAGTASIDMAYTTTTPGITIAPETITLIDPATLSAEPQYCTVDNVYQRFGSENVNQWADLNNLKIVDEIANAIIRSIVQVSATIDGRFNRKAYTVPFASPYPPTINEIAYLQSGYQLHYNRGMEDGDQTMEAVRMQAEQLLRGILGGQILLDADGPQRQPTYPTT